MPQKTTHENSPTTIVVPVYGDWESLGGCIDSLILQVAEHNKVILVNDCGPEVEMMETNIKQKIQGHKNFHYFRNAENKGFVQTCNRAVYELDDSNNDVLLLNSDTKVTAGFLEEMTAVLYLSDKHGIVVPRSNNATLASVPLFQAYPHERSDLDYAYSIYQAIRPDLPRFGVVPVTPGFCMLIRRNLITNFGLFDEVFGKGYNEENDFCLRVNQYGYSSIMANHAFVFHLESRSFSLKLKQELDNKNSLILLKRYPFYPLVIERYFHQFIDPIDRFADVIAKQVKTKVLIDLYHFPLAYSGSTKNGLSFLKYLKSLALDPKRYEVTILCQKDALSFHSLGDYGFRVVTPETIGDEIFQLAYCPSQIFHMENLLLLNKHALRIVFSLLDIISLRCQYLLTTDVKQRAIFLDSLKWADRIIAISDFTKKDAVMYFAPYSAEFETKITTIHQGFPGKTFADKEKNKLSEFRSQGHVLVLGNDFKHKATRDILTSLEALPYKVIIVGPKTLQSQAANITILPSGSIADETIEELYKGANLVIFPSQYEGFGFPIVEAAKHGKPLLYFDSEVGREITKLAHGAIKTRAFSSFNEIPALAKELIDAKSTPKTQAVRILDDYNAEVWDLVIGLAKQPYDQVDALRQRWQYLSNVKEYYFNASPAQASLRHRMQQNALKTLKQNYPDAYVKMRDTYRRLKG